MISGCGLSEIGRSSRAQGRGPQVEKRSFPFETTFCFVSSSCEAHGYRLSGGPDGGYC